MVREDVSVYKEMKFSYLTRTESLRSTKPKCVVLAEVYSLLSHPEGAEADSSQERLERIRKAIPGAKAIIRHPRASNKVTIVASNTTRWDQIIQNDIKGAEGVTRRPYLVMVMGVSLVKDRRCTENDKWIETKKTAKL